MTGSKRRLSLRSREAMARVLTAVAALALVLALAALLAWLFPLQYAELSRKIAYKRAGIQEGRAGGLHAFTQNRCSRAGARGLDCSCMVLIHGLGDQATTWTKILEVPASDWRRPVFLLAVDLPGFGKSPAPSDPKEYRVRNLAKAVQAAIDSVPESTCLRWTAVGNSLGGWVAAWLALESRKVNKLVLVDSAGLRVSAEPGGAGESVRALLADPTVESLKEFQRRAYFKPRKIPDRVWKLIVEKARNGNAKEMLAAQVPEDFLDKELPKLRKPMLVVWGAADRIIPKEQGRSLSLLVPGAAYREAPECGHLPQKECPKALVKALNEMSAFGAM